MEIDYWIHLSNAFWICILIMWVSKLNRRIVELERVKNPARLSAVDEKILSNRPLVERRMEVFDKNLKTWLKDTRKI